MTISAFDLILILGALLSFALGLGYFFLKEGKRSLGRRLLLFNGALLCSIFLLELFYSRYNDEAVKLSLLIVDSIKSLRMSADYNEVTKQVEVFGSEGLDTALRQFRTWVYMMVPVTGFTLVYDVVAGFSPALRLFFLRRRPMFVFSQLNERSLLLAEDIAKRKKADKPLLVFTDCGDGSSKLYQSAKAIGAVCLEEPLRRCDEFGKSRLCCLFLMQQGKDGIDDEENISMLRGLLSGENCVWPQKNGCGIFFFTNSADTVESVRAIKLDYKARMGEEENAKVKIHVVRDFAQSCAQLLDRQPLWRVAENLAPGEPLRLMVLGLNSFSKEMVKTLYWCAQLPEHPLQLCLVAPEGSEGFERWLRRDKSEIIDSCTEGADCLRYRPGEYARPYAALSFVSADLNSLDINSFLNCKRRYDFGSDEEFCLGDYDCFFIMGDRDGLNMQLAAELRRQLSYRYAGDEAVKYIYTLIEDENLSRTVELRYEAHRLRSSYPVEMQAFGSLPQRYSWDIVSMDSAYLNKDSSGPVIGDLHSLPGMEESRDDIYNEWSDAARAVHRGYKMFCAGCAVEPGEDRARATEEYLRRACSDEKLYFTLTWLEHRRWNAFLRAEGFRAPAGLYDALGSKSFEELCAQPQWRLKAYSYKNIPDRLHPCLVESSPNAGDEPDFLDTVSDLRDYVDGIACKVNSGKPAAFEAYGLKKYDAPDWEKM